MTSETVSLGKDWRRRRDLCLVNGRHTPGSRWARECPLLRVRNASNGVANTLIAGSPETADQTGDNSQGSKTGFAPLAVAAEAPSTHRPAGHRCEPLGSAVASPRQGRVGLLSRDSPHREQVPEPRLKSASLS